MSVSVCVLVCEPKRRSNHGGATRAPCRTNRMNNVEQNNKTTPSATTTKQNNKTTSSSVHLDDPTTSRCLRMRPTNYSTPEVWTRSKIFGIKSSYTVLQLTFSCTVWLLCSPVGLFVHTSSEGEDCFLSCSLYSRSRRILAGKMPAEPNIDHSYGSMDPFDNVHFFRGLYILLSTNPLMNSLINPQKLLLIFQVRTHGVGVCRFSVPPHWWCGVKWLHSVDIHLS